MESHLIKYNVGCGKRNFGRDWFNVDGADMPHIGSNDIHLRSTLDNHIDLLYSSHLIAYFDANEGLQLLKEWYRVIKPGGRIEIATPDFEKMAFMHNNNRCNIDDLIGPLYGRMLLGKDFIYHKTTYTFHKLALLMKEAGFTHVKSYNHFETCHPNTGSREDKYDDHSAAYINGELISLNIQAIKPSI